ncbi:MAG: sulfotransferase domain-containing protein [Cyanobacteria bacterium J06592_8]
MLDKPDFIVIGAAKSGTTTLYEYLSRHPQIYMSKVKEPDFFALDQNYERGLDWYQSLFSPAQPDQVCGEASTTYSRLHQHPKTVERLAKCLPNVKLIYIIRNPVDRAYSFYQYRFKGSQRNPEFLAKRNELMTAKTFEEAIQQQSEFIDSSFYLYQIEKYLEYYPRESFLFLLMEDLTQQPLQALNQICQFIGVRPDIDLTQSGEIVANQGKNQPEWYVRNQLTGPLKSVPGFQFLSRLIPKELKDQIYQMVRGFSYKQWKSAQYVPPAMLPETRQILIEKFREPNQKLAEFLNRDLSHWNQ